MDATVNKRIGTAALGCLLTLGCRHVGPRVECPGVQPCCGQALATDAPAAWTGGPVPTTAEPALADATPLPAAPAPGVLVPEPGVREAAVAVATPDATRERVRRRDFTDHTASPSCASAADHSWLV